MTVPEIRRVLRNVRTATLDLDNLYGGPAPRDRPRMILGRVSATGSTDPPLARPPGKTDNNDVPRKPRSSNPEEDREALIGDPRNGRACTGVIGVDGSGRRPAPYDAGPLRLFAEELLTLLRRPPSAGRAT